MRSYKFYSIASALSMAALTACGTSQSLYDPNYPSGSYSYGTYPNQPAAANQSVASVEYGRITNMQLVSAGTRASNPNRGAVGSVIGGVVGGLLGSNVGQGSGRGAATVLGALGGAVVGNRLARNSDGSYATADPVYRVTVQTDAGQLRTYDIVANSELRIGDRVRIENGVIYLA